MCMSRKHNGRGGEIGGGRGGFSPPLWKQGGLSPPPPPPPPHFITCPYYKLQQHSSGCLQKSARVKIATESAKKTATRMHQKHSQRIKISKIFWGSMPPDPLGGLWAYAHSLTVITVHSRKSEPPHFCYLFSALEWACIMHRVGVATLALFVTPVDRIHRFDAH